MTLEHKSVACDIIIPVWNQPALTQRCLDSLAASTPGPHQVILIDNGSEAPTRQLLEAYAAEHPGRVRVIRNPENLGFIKAANQGLRASTNPFVCLLNNDTVVTDGWLDEMIHVADRDSRIGLVNPSSNTLGYTPPQATLEGVRRYATSLTAQRGQVRRMAMGVGFCLLIRRAVLDAIGLLDERYGMGNFEDADLSKRALAAGYRCVQALGAYVYHEEKASFKHQTHWKRAFRENQQAFYAKWGRPLRILWDLPAHSMGQEWTALMLRLLDAGHWLTYPHPAEDLPTLVRDHAGVNCLQGQAPLWYVLKRRKKPVDLIVTANPRLARWLACLKRLHQATVLMTPSPTQLETLCQQRSRSL